MTNAWKVTAQSEKGEVTTIINCDNENEAWTRAERLFSGKVWNGIVERFPLYETLRAQNAELREALQEIATSSKHLNDEGMEEVHGLKAMVMRRHARAILAKYGDDNA